MTYKALYRRFRPITFDDVIGQESIIQTLKSQIANHSIGHAYLFTGSRGTGKTTTSKVLARAVNCDYLVDFNPCNSCEHCLSALNETAMDLVEMDAASHNGVDDIRELRESVKFPPSHGRYKVMIIDEVHMLSKGAFNALLKTLEEPPSYMIFILATTEPHKVPATITSRCQRFEFKRIDYMAITSYLKKLTLSLNAQVDEDALSLIVRLSEGAMRDALSLLEQCLSYAGERLTLEIASQILGRSDTDNITSFAQGLLDKQLVSLMTMAREHYRNGKEALLLLLDLVEVFRAGMLLMTLGNSEQKDVDDSTLRWLEKATVVYPIQDWLFILDELLQSEQKIKYTSQPWTVLEVQLAKICLKTKEVESKVSTAKKHLEQRKDSVFKEEPKLPVQGEEEGVNLQENLPTTSEGNELTLEQIKEKWDIYLQAVRKQLVSTYALMKEVQPVFYQEGLVKFHLNEMLKILKPALENHDNITHIQRAFYNTYGISPKVVILDTPLEDTRAKELTDFFREVVDPNQIVIK
jgi:DNA polymerase-3 subunit gamma/tau